MIWFWKVLRRRRRIKNLLNQFVQFYEKNEEFQQQMEHLQRAIQTEEWKFYTQLLMTIKGIMATDMFSKQHTILNEKEKDIVQRTYYNIDQMLTFLVNPLGWMEKRSKWRNLTTNLKRKEK